MDAELLGAHGHQAGVGLGHLVFGHAVLGVAGVVHDAVAQIKGAAGIVAAEHRFGHAGHFGQEIHMGQVVQVDESPQVVGLFHILGRGVVGGKHDLAAGKAAGFGQLQLGIAGAVHTAALLLQDREQIGVGRGLDGEIFLEALVPGKGLVDAAGVFADALLVIQVERRGHIGKDVLRLVQRDERPFL